MTALHLVHGHVLLLPLGSALLQLWRHGGGLEILLDLPPGLQLDAEGVEETCSPVFHQGYPIPQVLHLELGKVGRGGGVLRDINVGQEVLEGEG